MENPNKHHIPSTENIEVPQTEEKTRKSKVATNLLKHLYKLGHYGTPLTPEDLGPLAEKIASLEEMVPGIVSNEKIISLDNYPDETTEPRQESGDVDSDINFVSAVSNFLDNLQTDKPEEFTALKIKFKDSVIVDLGAGSDFGSNYRIACLLGAKGYIGIEPFNWQQLFGSCLTLNHPWFSKPENPLINLVAQDAVSFLKRLPDNSVCILNAGIGDILTNQEYIEDFEREMARVLKKGGVCMISNSNNPEGMDKYIYETGFIQENKRKGIKYHGPIRIVEK